MMASDSILEESLRLLAKTPVPKKDADADVADVAVVAPPSRDKASILERAMASPEIALEPVRYAKVFEALRLLEEYAAEVRALLPVKPKRD